MSNQKIERHRQEPINHDFWQSYLLDPYADKSLDNAIIHDKYLYIPTSENLVKKNYIRIAAKKVERRNQYWEKLDSGIFTACDICKKEGSNKYESPLVQVKAKKIIHDKKEKIVKFYDSYLDVKGKSIFYLPYFSVASPLVKRKAGFIAPSYKQNYYFGLSADIPYYIPFNDHHDITIQPKFSQKKIQHFTLSIEKILEMVKLLLILVEQ